MSLNSVLLIAATIAITGGAIRPPPVNIYKCCRIGETLSADGSVCEPGGLNLWAPTVYAPLRKMYLPKGTMPQNWKVIEAERPKCPGDVPLEPIKASAAHAFLIFANGSLYISDREHQLLPPSSYCADSHVALVCPLEGTAAPERNHGGLYVRKCCGEGGVYSDEKGACLNAPNQDKNELLKLIHVENSSNIPALTSGFPHCKGDATMFVVAGRLEDSRLNSNSGLIVGNSVLFENSYCVELSDKGGGYVYACPGDVPVKKWDLRFTLYPVGLLVSAAFLAATLAAGLAAPNGHHALHWRCQTHYIACLLLGDILLAITQLTENQLGANVCIAVAILMHFFFLAAFFWLNTMCVNIWWTFRDFRPTSLDARAQRMRLKIYYIYAWGGPILIAGVAAILDWMPEHEDYTFLRPKFGRETCWFYDDVAKLAYFFGPLGVLLAINLILFASTARQLTCGLWKREEVKSTTERAALGRVCLKLVVVMGVTWALDVISWACGGPEYLWYVTDFANALQGLFIFLVLGTHSAAACCRKRSPPPASLDSTHVTHHASLKVPLETVC